MPLMIHTFQDLDAAALHLSEASLVRRASNPLAQRERPLVLCPSKGISTWVKQRMAQALGIFAGVDLTMVGPFAQSLVRGFCERTGRADASIPDIAGGRQSDADREALQWFIYQQLGALEDETVSHYLGGEAGRVVRQQQLADALDRLFQNYLIFRHDMVLGWEEDTPAGEPLTHEAWQRTVWRGIMQQPSLQWLRTRAIDFRDMLASWQSARPPELPERIFVIAIGQWPELFLRLLAAAARHVEIHLYLPEIALCVPVLSDEAPTARTPFFLHQMGRQSRLQMDMIEALSEASFEGPLPALSVATTNLGRMQEALYTGADLSLAARDDSLLIHSCHAPLRELEVLRDAILAYLAEDETRAPRDILVVAPDLDTYAPLIHAVFDRPLPTGTFAHKPLLYQIAEQAPVAEDSAAMAFAYLLRLGEGPLSAETVMACFDFTALCNAAGVIEDDLPKLIDWVRQLNIHVGLEKKDPHSWQRGLSRLLMGYAMGPDVEMVGALAPFAPDMASDAELLGRFAQYLKRLFRHLEALQGEKTLREWAQALRAMADDLLVWSPETERHEWSILDPILALEHEATAAHQVPFEAVRRRFLDALENQYQGRRFLTGGITFCGLKPLRGVPFGMVAILGLNDGALPVKSEPPAFDLMAQDKKKRRYDPDPAADDRQAFLDTLLATRDRLHLSYIGQSQADNKPLPPSICLSELIECVTPDAPDTLVCKHHLQPFHEDYFQGEASSEEGLPLTFDPTFMNAGTAVPSFCGDVIPLSNQEARDLPVRDLITFFTSPLEAFCAKQLNINLPWKDQPLPEEEYLSCNALASYNLKNKLVEQPPQEAPAGQDQTLAQMQALALLPMAPFDNLCYRDLVAETDPYRKKIQAYTQATPAAISVTCGAITLVGTLDALTTDGTLLFARPTGIRSKDYLQAWIWHLCASCAGLAPPQTVLHGLDKGKVETVTFAPVADAPTVLADLCAIYLEGMTHPLPFLPKSSFTYGKTLFGGKMIGRGKDKREPVHADALKRAKGEYYPPSGNYSASPGDSEDTYFKICFRDVDLFKNDALCETFVDLATRVYQPLFAVKEGDA